MTWKNELSAKEKSKLMSFLLKVLSIKSKKKPVQVETNEAFDKLANETTKNLPSQVLPQPPADNSET